MEAYWINYSRTIFYYKKQKLSERFIFRLLDVCKKISIYVLSLESLVHIYLLHHYFSIR